MEIEAKKRGNSKPKTGSKDSKRAGFVRQSLLG